MVKASRSHDPNSWVLLAGGTSERGVLGWGRWPVVEEVGEVQKG